MNFTRLKTLWGKYSDLKMLSSLYGVSFAIVFMLFVFAVPHLAHADIGSTIVGWFGDLVGKAADATFGALMRGVGYLVLAIANLLLFLVGVLFNYVIVYTVFQFGNYFGNSAGLLAAWGILRDVANIMLIFGFVMLGMATILDIHGYEVKKTLPRLIIFAILMNFSLLASEAVIDTANAFASVFYSQASTLCQGDEKTCAGSATNGGISGEIFQMSGLNNIFSTNNTAASSTGTGEDDTSNTRWAIAYIGMAIFVTILCVVLLAGTVMLITRAIMLAILMVLSPLGFAGFAIPPLEKYALDWWHRLLSQAFFAPIYLVFVFVALKIVQGMSSGSINIETAIISGSTSALGSVFLFAILVGFLVAALMTAKQMGAVGASFATSMATTAISYPFAALGRQTAGRGAAASARVFQSWVGNQNKGGTGRAVAGTLKFFGADRAIYGGLKQISGATVAGHESYDDMQKKDTEFASHAKHAAESDELKEALASNNDKLAESLAQKMNITTLKETLNKCSDAEIAALGKILGADTYDKLMNDKDVSPGAQHALGHGRFGAFDRFKDVDITAMAPADQKVLQKSMRDLGTKDAELLAKYDAQLFSNMVTASNGDKESLFSDEQNEFVAKSNNVSKRVRELTKENTRVGRVERWLEDPSAAVKSDGITLHASLNAEEKMKLKTTTVMKHRVELLKDYDAQDINAALTKTKFNKAQLQDVKTELLKRKADFDPYFTPGSLQHGLIGGWP